MISFYHNFIDIHKDTNRFVVQLFIREAKMFLNDYYKVPWARADTIANTLCHSMLNENLHYHTPVHILCMIDAARTLKIDLKSWELLAIWFHDCVYDVKNKPGENERLSAALLAALMTSYATEEDMYLAGNAILATAKHLDKDVPVAYRQLLDLDLISFSFERKQYELVTELIRQEYQISPIEFNKGRSSFLQKLLSKGSVYRTPFFLNNFEEKAQKNIEEDLQQLTKSV